MNDKTDFSFSFSVGQKAAPKTKDTEDLIALDACKVYRLPQDRLLVRNARTGNSTTIRADVFSALTLCEAFRTPDEHVAELVKRMGAPPDQVGQIRKVINDSLDRGLLVSSTDICQALTAGKVSEGDTGSGDLGAAVGHQLLDRLVQRLGLLVGGAGVDDVRQLVSAHGLASASLRPFGPAPRPVGGPAEQRG